MARQKNWDWNLAEEKDGRYAFDQIQANVLLDIRDELQRLNRLLQCQNFRRIPFVLRSIRQNTSKPRKKHLIKAVHKRFSDLIAKLKPKPQTKKRKRKK